MDTIHIDHVDTVQVTGDSASLPVLQDIKTILEDIQARLASLADQQAGGQS